MQGNFTSQDQYQFPNVSWLVSRFIVSNLVMVWRGEISLCNGKVHTSTSTNGFSENKIGSVNPI